MARPPLGAGAPNTRTERTTLQHGGGGDGGGGGGGGSRGRAESSDPLASRPKEKKLEFRN